MFDFYYNNSIITIENINIIKALHCFNRISYFTVKKLCVYIIKWY